MNQRESSGLPLRAIVMVLLFLGVVFLLVGFQALSGGDDSADSDSITTSITSTPTTPSSTAAPAKAEVEVFNISSTEGAAETIAQVTGGDGFSVVVDATGNLNSIENGFAYVSHGGTYVLVSIVKGSISFNDAEFHKREMSLIGSRNATRQDFDHVTASIRSGRVPVKDLITHRTTPAKAINDLPRWSADKRNLVKALIEY